jgi:MerR family mercuric resistance operon transcriptional regulator
MAMRALTIGTAAREAGVGVETIRFYERQKLIERPAKPAGAGVRRYPSETIARIRFIREAQQLGFSLREIRELLALRADPAADCSKVREQALTKLHEVRDKIERLRQIGAALETLITACPAQGSLQACSIIDALEMRSRRTMEASESSRNSDRPPRRTRT